MEPIFMSRPPSIMQNRSAMTIPTELTDKKGYILYLKQEIEGRE